MNYGIFRQVYYSVFLVKRMNVLACRFNESNYLYSEAVPRDVNENDVLELCG